MIHSQKFNLCNGGHFSFSFGVHIRKFYETRHNLPLSSFPKPQKNRRERSFSIPHKGDQIYRLIPFIYD